jgi:cytosine deaminase
MKARSAVKAEDAKADLGAVHLNGKTVAIHLDQGRIARIKPVPGPARAVILPLPVDPHVHLDKAYTAHRAHATKPGLFGAIEAMAKDRARWTEADLRTRINRGMAEACSHGLTALRSHVDWTEPRVPLAWGIMAEIAADWRGRVALQRSSLTSLDLLGDVDHGPGIASRVAQDGATLGCFVYRNDSLPEKLARVFRLAADCGLHLDFHVDEGLEVAATGIDEIARLTHAFGMQGRVLCGHGCSLAIRPDADRAMALAAQAGLALTILPTTNLHLQDMTPGRSPRLRGLAPAQELRRAGVTVLFGADNVRDAFYPGGSHDALEMLRLACLVLQLDPADWVDAISTAPAAALGLTPPQIAPGAPADFIVIPGADWREALADPRSPRHIFRAGTQTT